ncbi:MAG: B12-binding domain-containing radical SAM protein [Solirubrobacterales bacterium]
MKIVLAAVNAKYIHSNLGIRYLKAYAQELDLNIEIMEFSINDSREKVIQQLILAKADIIGFSCYIWNIEYIQYLSTHIKLINPGCIIIYGGPEVSFDPFMQLNNNAGDIIIEGEGEETFFELMELWKTSKVNEFLEDATNSKIKGLYTKLNGEIHYNGVRDLMDMNKVKFPYDTLNELENKIVYFEASRGCPFLCKYCLSSTSHGVRFKSIETVRQELDFFIENKVKLVKFVDRTFNCNKKFAMDIWGYLIEKNPSTKFHFEISADLLSLEEIQLLSKARAGLFQFEVGVQSTNREVLKNINRFVNFDDINIKVNEIKAMNNISQHLDLIAGLPGEDLESFKNSFNQVYSIQPEEIQLGFLKLLKGSKMRDEAVEWGMLYSPYAPYEILKTNNLSYSDLIKLKRIEEVLDKYYNSNKFKNILNYFLPKFDSAFDFYLKLSEFFYINGYLNRNISFADYYKIFIEFHEDTISEDSLLLKEIIKFDYLIHNKKKWLPEFLLRDINKDVEKKIKGEIRKKGFVSLENCHIEKFYVNLYKYFKSGFFENGEFYLLFNEQGDIYTNDGEENFTIWR